MVQEWDFIDIPAFQTFKKHELQVKNMLPYTNIAIYRVLWLCGFLFWKHFACQPRSSVNTCGRLKQHTPKDRPQNLSRALSGILTVVSWYQKLRFMLIFIFSVFFKSRGYYLFWQFPHWICNVHKLCDRGHCLSLAKGTDLQFSSRF